MCRPVTAAGERWSGAGLGAGARRATSAAPGTVVPRLIGAGMNPAVIAKTNETTTGRTAVMSCRSWADVTATRLAVYAILLHVVEAAPAATYKLLHGPATWPIGGTSGFGRLHYLAIGQQHPDLPFEVILGGDIGYGYPCLPSLVESESLGERSYRIENVFSRIGLEPDMSDNDSSLRREVCHPDEELLALVNNSRRTRVRPGNGTNTRADRRCGRRWRIVSVRRSALGGR